jgi:ERCC4-type nuclease
MDFKFLNTKIIEKLERINFYLFYYGYDLYQFLSDSLDVLKNNNSIFIINFDEASVDKINKDGAHKIYSTETNKRKNLYLQKNAIFYLSSKVLLLDLLTNQLSSDIISILIIGCDKYLEQDSKEIFIMKYLLNNSQNTKLVIINNKPDSFVRDFMFLKQNTVLSANQFKMNMYPRNYCIIDKTIEYNFNNRDISIYEYNEFNNKIEQVQKLLIQLYNNCVSEVVRLTRSNSDYDCSNDHVFRILQLENFTNPSTTALITQLIDEYFFPTKARMLIRDLLAIKKLIVRLEYNDYPTFLTIFNRILKDSEEYSFFSYRDNETTDIIESIRKTLKGYFYRIINCQSVVDAGLELYPRLLNLNEQNLNILQNREIEYFNFEEVNFKNVRLTEILNKIENKRVLVLTYDSETLRDYLSSYYILKDYGFTFCEKRFRNYLVTKHEFNKRQNILKSFSNTEYYVETLLLHKKSIDLCYKYEQKYEGLFQKMLGLLGDDDKLPSEVEFKQDIYIENDFTSFRPNNLKPGCKIFVESFQGDENIKLLEFIRENNIQIIIFHHYQLELLRSIEAIICNYETDISEVHILNSVNSLKFETDLNKIKSEFLIFKKLFEDHKLYQNDINRVDNHKKDNLLKAKTNKNILIDFREMSAKVPYYLYDFGFNIVVGGLEIGDYITSNSVCIERKSVTTGDLYESLKGGRLFNQIIKMQKYFEHLIILIEFEEDLETNKNFFNNKFLYRKLLELRMLSNKIHFLWSYSPKMTSVVLNSLKSKYNDYLDINRCLNINKNEKPSVNNFPTQEVPVNSTKQKSIESFIRNSSNGNNIDSKLSAVDKLEGQYEDDAGQDGTKKIELCIERFIRKIDGVNNNNYHLVAKYFKNLKEFITCSKDKLNSIFGNSGTKIYYYFNNRYNYVKN